MTNANEMLARLNAFRANDGKAPLAKWKNARHAPQLDAYVNGEAVTVDVAPVELPITDAQLAEVLAPVTDEQIAAHVDAAPVVELAPLAPVKAPTKKMQLRAFITAQAASVDMIATHFAISLAAARSLIGDIQREGDKLIVEKIEGARAGFYTYAK